MSGDTSEQGCHMKRKKILPVGASSIFFTNCVLFFTKCSVLLTSALLRIVDTFTSFTIDISCRLFGGCVVMETAGHVPACVT